MSSKTVDQRVVEMRFDNKEFEKNVSTTMSTLDKLNQRLNLTGATKGLEEVNEASKNVNMSGLTSAVDTVRSKFSALEVMAVTALMNITNSAVNAGKRVVSALTVDPIKAGFSEYELKMDSIQTIMAGTGESLETVNKYLEELNTYSDKTIYSFSDMTQNIGKFTNAGVKLKDAVLAIQGISNVAAVSGANANEASRAMYNFSQALSAGYVKLMDWKSIENANMATVEFKTQLIESAVAAGTLKKTTDGMYKTLEGTVINATKNFNDSLQDQWMTTDVLISTLGKYSDETTDIGKKAFAAAQDLKTLSQMYDTLKESAQSGWAQSWEIITGDFEEAKALWTEVGGVIGGIISASANARNEMLKGWKDLGGRTALVEALRNAFKGVSSVIKPVKEAFREIFPRMTGKQLFEITEGLKKFTEKLKIGEGTADKLKRTFKGLFALINIGVKIFSAIAGGVADLLGYIVPAGDGVLGFTAAIGDGIVKLNEFVSSTNIFTRAIKKITTVLGTVVKGVVNFVSNVATAIKEFANIDTSGVSTFTDGVAKRFKPFTALGEGIKKMFQILGAVIKKVAPVFFTLAGKIGEAFNNLMDAIGNAVSNGDFKALFDIVNGLLTGGLIVGIKKFVDSLTGMADSAGGFIEGLKSIFGVFEAYQQSIKADAIKKIATAIAILAASLLVMSFIDSEKLTSALGAISTLFIELFGSLAIFDKIVGGDGLKSIGKVSFAMIGLSAAVLILSFAVTKLAKLDWEGLAKGLVGVAALVATLTISAKTLSESSGKLIKGATGLIAFSAAILILTNAVEALGKLNLGELTKGLISVGILCVGLSEFLNRTDLNGMGLGKGLGILLLATSINILASAVSKFGALDISSIIKGLGSVAVVLTAVAVFVNNTGDSKKVIRTATGLTIIAASMLIFAKAIDKMGSMNINKIGKGLLTMGSALAIVIVALKAMPKNILGTSVSLIALATSLVIMSNALNSMGSMSWEELGKSLLVLAGSLTAIVVAMQFMNSGLAGAAAMLVISTSLNVLAAALIKFGSMTLGEIATGLLTLVAAFAVIGGAAAILTPVVPVIVALGAGIALLGAGCLAAGAGVLAFSVALTTFGGSVGVLVTAIVATVSGLVGLIPMIIKKIGEGIVELLRLIANSGKEICAAISTILLAVIRALTEAIPPLIKCLGKLLDSLLKFIVEYVPKIVKAACDMVVGIINGIAEKLPDLIQAGFNLVIKFINSLANAIRDNRKKIRDAAKNLGDAIIDGLTGGLWSKAKNVWQGIKDIAKGALDKIKEFLGIHSPSRKFKEIGVYMIQGLVNGIKSAVGSVFSAAKNAVQNAISAVTSRVSSFFSAGKNIVSNIASGIRNMVYSAKTAVSNVVGSALSAVKGKASGFIAAGKNVITGFANGIRSAVSSVASTAANMARSALDAAKRVLGIKSPSREFEEVGMYSDEGLAIGLEKFSKVVDKSAEDVGKSAIKSLGDSMSKIPDIVDSDMNAQPTIKPVLDLSQIQSESGKIGGMFNKQTVAVAGISAGITTESMNTLAGIAAQMQSTQQTGNSALIKAINSLKEDFGDLVDVISGLQVNMDGDAVVGHLIGKIDNGLGQIANHKGRGN